MRLAVVSCLSGRPYLWNKKTAVDNGYFITVPPTLSAVIVNISIYETVTFLDRLCRDFHETSLTIEITTPSSVLERALKIIIREESEPGLRYDLAEFKVPIDHAPEYRLTNGADGEVEI